MRHFHHNYEPVPYGAYCRGEAPFHHQCLSESVSQSVSANDHITVGNHIPVGKCQIEKRQQCTYTYTVHHVTSDCFPFFQTWKITVEYFLPHNVSSEYTHRSTHAPDLRLNVSVKLHCNENQHRRNQRVLQTKKKDIRCSHPRRNGMFFRKSGTLSFGAPMVTIFTTATFSPPPMATPRFRSRSTSRAIRSGPPTADPQHAPLHLIPSAEALRPKAHILPALAMTAALAATLLLGPPHASGAGARAAGVLSGTPRVVDGDTLVFTKTRVRLHALDAPELRQTCKRRGALVPCGVEAKRALQSIVDHARVVECTPVHGHQGRDQFGRIVAKCRVRSEDVGSLLVKDGHAVADTRFGNDYVALENKARREKRYVASFFFLLFFKKYMPLLWSALLAIIHSSSPSQQASNTLSLCGIVFHSCQWSVQRRVGNWIWTAERLEKVEARYLAVTCSRGSYTRCVTPLIFFPHVNCVTIRLVKFVLL